MDGNDERWSSLCSKYTRAKEKNSNDAFVVGRLAIHLRKALAEACRCPESYVSHFQYEHGYVPDDDTHEQVKDGWASVTGTPAGWVIGLGVQLEIAPNAYPKTIIVFPVTVKHAGDLLEVGSTLFSGTEQIRFSNYESDLRAVAERIYLGLDEALDNWIASDPVPRKFGFG